MEGMGRSDSWGYIDRTGEVRLRCQFSMTSPFHEGFASVMVGQVQGNSMFIDTTGEPLPLRPFRWCGANFSEGLAKIYSKEEQTYVFVDKSNRSVGADHGSNSFHEGLAVVSVSTDKKDSDGLPIGGSRVIDKSGHYVSPTFQDAMWQFNEGLLAVRVDGKWGYIDRAGHFAIKPSFVYASNFHDGRAIVRNKISSDYAYMDKMGNLIRMDKYEQISDFREGLAPVCSNGKWGYVDTQGKLVIPCRFDKAGLFQEGLAAVVQAKSADRSSNRIGFIDKDGKQAIPFDFVDVKGGFSDGLAAVAVVDKSRSDYWLYGYVDHYGRWKIKPVYDDAQPFSEGLAAICVIEKKFYPHPKQQHNSLELFLRRDERIVGKL
jgi:hypothetical protein